MNDDNTDSIKIKGLSSLFILVVPITAVLTISFVIMVGTQNLFFFLVSILTGAFVIILFRIFTFRVLEVGALGIKIENSFKNTVIPWAEVESIAYSPLPYSFFYALKTQTAGTIFLSSRTFFRDEGIESFFLKYGNFEEIASAMPISQLTRWKKRGMEYVSPTLSDKMATPFFPSSAKIGRFYKFLLIICTIIVIISVLYFNFGR
ncbi:hypothetical protein A2V56_02480 [Candidatus Woesebacteria bacterium RBG_19FT_COMBO_42_9]|uniref:PH domain-containing protein n=1 Tax=Candidatus Woesebacteria bacterium RBG_16_42_24 TaxID=1802485 RepID=A0A1F7XL71_9BACT|nr:MAG: hypothetical protein A2V97_03300 [Candidatus Woesebacteria bacterium RBG_16_42_24]OGM16986.1 MAG: hypothetical protein A2V56_02480 [Candidatus Woesebacteria bacterium RBG_19FT_COMBO_42_9]OGM68437.1 MAG: hypothetical protein A2985_01405 [Candidatus Woesebacteria bacterium RIFCSPLOWO2_01_FULL_43_11]